jgi:4-amino-4-deoxy-L-arabinose transferase-like glycosyltransferase
MTTITTQLRRYWPVVALLLLASLLLAPGLGLPTSLAGLAAWAVLGAPGFLLAWRLYDDEDALARVWLGLCGALALASLLLLALHALPGPLPAWLLVGSCLVLSLLVLLVPGGSDGKGERATSDARLGLLALAAILVVAAALRLPNLNASELQGDEARALLMAVGVLEGQAEVLLVHKKGPVEILLPAGPLVALGEVNEGAARLPFALAGIATTLGAYLVARRMFAAEGRALAATAGLIAAAIVAVDGFLIAFSRIVQYQSVLVLMSLAALYLCWRFYAGEGRWARDLICAAALASVGLLAHYDGIYVLPSLALLLLAGLWRRRWGPRGWALGLGLPLLTGLVLTGSFYLPFALHERFARTAGYLFDRAGQGDESALVFYNNLPAYYLLGSFYNTEFQMTWLGLALLACVLCWLPLYLRPRLLGWVLAGALLAGVLTMVYQGERFALGEERDDGNWALALFLPAALGLVLSPATPMALRTLVLWFGCAFLAHSFVIARPQTHFYTMDVPGALLIGLGCARLAAWLRAQRLGLARLPLAAAGLSLFALAVPYMHIVYVRQTPPYQLTFPEGRPDIYRARYKDQLPQASGYFGFPHGSGWKTVGDLYRQGLLHGDYNSNEEELVTGWYTRGAFRCNSKPVYYFIARRPRDAQEVPVQEIQEDYRLFGYVLRNNEQVLDIYTRLPVETPQVFRDEEHAQAFDSWTVSSFPTLRSLHETLPQFGLDAAWQQGLLLRGYDLDYAEIGPGQRATFSLYWQAAQPIAPGYELVVELVDEGGRLVGAARAHCGVHPIEKWHNNKLANRAFTISHDPALPPGRYTLRTALVNPQSGERIPLADGAAALAFAQLTMSPQPVARSE